MRRDAHKPLGPEKIAAVGIAPKTLLDLHPELARPLQYKRPVNKGSATPELIKRVGVGNREEAVYRSDTK